MRSCLLCCFLSILAGCSREPSVPPTASQEEPAEAKAALLEVRGDEVRVFFEQWSSYQADVLKRNVEAFERRYLELKKDPPKDPKTGKSMDLRPSMAMIPSGFGPLARSASPAVNTFERHLDGGGDGLIGYIPEPAARLRVWVADRGVAARWYLYSLSALEKERPYPTFRDTIGARELGREAEQQMLFAAKDALAGKLNPLDFGRNGTYIETKPLAFDSPSCITCHPNKKLGDLAGIMVYGVWDKKDTKLEPQAQALLGEPRIPSLTPESSARWQPPRLRTR